MKYLAFLSILILSLNLYANDTTVILLNYKLEKTKAKKAMYIQKLVEESPDVWYCVINDINGLPRLVGYYKKHKKKFIKHGLCEEYDFSGNLEAKGEYDNGNRVGLWNTFYTTGEHKEKGIYNENGEKDSVWVTDHENGKLLTQGTWENGKQTGEWIAYDEDGNIDFKEFYNPEGNLDGAYVSYGKSNLTYDTGTYDNGEKVGEWLYFFNSGKPSGKVSYEKGKLVTANYWNEDGTEVDTNQQVVNQLPAYPGGESAMYKFLGQTLQYPAFAQDNNIQGRVYVSFVVEKNGKLSDFRILRSPGISLSKETLRTMKKMPNWELGIEENRKVRVRFNLPVVFQLK